MQIVNVELPERSYPIYIGKGLLDNAELLRSHVKGKQVAIVTNDTVAPLYLDKVKAAFSGYTLNQIILPDGEVHKTIGTASLIFDQLLQNRHNRSTTLIALGGGVVGDITGFTAACYQRGVNFIQLPTTLLAQVDSSVGGKTGVNHPMGKNMIGAFYQPQAVITDTATLDSLPQRELAAGFAEVLKYGLIVDSEFLEWIGKNHSAVLARDPDALTYAIRKSCENKASVVAQDERESGLRAILNLGHTFGHAIETFTGYREWLHGEAVAVGMVMAADMSCRLGWITSKHAQLVRNLVEKSGLPATPPVNLLPEHFIELMAVDKKVLDGRLRLVLLKKLGEAVVNSDFAVSALNETLAAGDLLCRQNTST